VVRRVIAGIGRTCIATGVLLLLFVAYQLWGTGIATAREQRALTNKFDDRMAELGVSLGDPTGLPPAVTPTTVAPTTTAAPVTTIASSPSSVVPTSNAPVTTAAPATTRPPEIRSRDKRTKRVEAKPGDLLARIKIPEIGVDDIIVGGVKKEDLKKGPGHYPGSPLPGSAGNAAIAGHRTTYGAPFFRLNELKAGSPIFVATVATGEWFRYEVLDIKVVSPKDNYVLNPRPGLNTLTLTTCHPRYSAAKRLIVTAKLVGEAVEQDIVYTEEAVDSPDELASESTVETTVAPAAPDEPSTTASATPTPLQPDPTVPAGRAAQGETHKLWWFRGTTSQWTDTGIWAAICAAIALATWLLARGRRQLILRWGIYAVGTVVVFLPALYFAFENLARLLPENV
jgi:sortase A